MSEFKRRELLKSSTLNASDILFQFSQGSPVRDLALSYRLFNYGNPICIAAQGPRWETLRD